MKFYLLNVFTKNFLAGNQLAAVFPENALSLTEMQSIAREFNFSETIFFDPTVISPKIRIFTPMSELPFAGHPTVGAAWLLYHLKKQNSEFSIDLPLGNVKVSATKEEALLTFPGEALIKDYTGDLNSLLKHCQVAVDDVLLNEIKVVNVGPEFTIIPLKNHQALSQATSPITFNENVKVYFCFQENPQQYFVRMFAPSLSVVEDAATGSAACALGSYLKMFKGQAQGTVLISQGKEMARECEIKLQWDSTIQVGGEVKMWGEGHLSD
jgi:trans-2,3-dihydro-3-hydroxyanthranilate isomerase